MLAFLVDNKEMITIVGILDQLEDKIGTDAFRELIPILLTDNGCEFADPESFEYGMTGSKRTNIYYCEPRMSNQKGRLEKNHEYIRYVIPKGESFDDLTQADVTKMTNHINSTARPGLEGRKPTDIALQCIDPEILEMLGIEPIDGDHVCLKKDLFKKEEIR
jgi:IS30 family transposase